MDSAPPFPMEPPLAKFVQDFKDQLVKDKQFEMLDKAVKQAHQKDIKQLNDWKIDSADRFLLFASGMLTWIPSEDVGGKEIYSILCLFYFIFDQKAKNGLHTLIHTDSIGKPLTPLSNWVLDFAKEVGTFMSTPKSITTASYQTFIDSPRFNLDEAIVPPEGFKTFNQLFARDLKPGMRPVSSPEDDKVIVCPADSVFDGVWDISNDNTMSIDTYQIQTAKIKNLDWPIHALLAGKLHLHHDSFDLASLMIFNLQTPLHVCFSPTIPFAPSASHPTFTKKHD